MFSGKNIYDQTKVYTSTSSSACQKDPKGVEDGPTFVSEPNVLGEKHFSTATPQNQRRHFYYPQRDRPTKKCYRPTDSNGVWYSSFWSERPKNHLNLKILVSNFPPWDLEGCRTDLKWQRHRSQHRVGGGSMGLTFVLVKAVNLDKSIQLSGPFCIWRDLNVQHIIPIIVSP